MTEAGLEPRAARLQAMLPSFWDLTQYTLPALCLKVAANTHFPDATGFICS